LKIRLMVEHKDEIRAHLGRETEVYYNPNDKRNLNHYERCLLLVYPL